MTDLNVGEKLIEGKTKIVHLLPDHPGQVLLQQKDRITAGDGVRKHDLEGKAAIATATTAAIFNLLNSAGIKTHFVRTHGKNGFISQHCDMIPIEWVARRVATGSFLRRHPGVKEGYRFNPPKIEYFFKDDENHDPQWSYEQLVMAELKHGGRVVGPAEVDILTRTTACVFEVLERAWATLDCALIDMKIEFGVMPSTGELLLADVIDSESWRLWPSGDRRLMKDKQVYREMAEVTAEGLQNVKRNFQWVADRVTLLQEQPLGQVVVMMGSASDMGQGEKVKTECASLGIPCHLRVTSAHKGTEETLRILAHYEGSGVPTVFIAIAGRSNGLGPVLSGNATWPVINCPPVTPDWGAQDVWSSLRMPSGLGCATVLSPQASALHAANILAMRDHVIWGRLRARQLNTWINLKMSDDKIQKDK